MDLSETRFAPGAAGGATTLLEPGSAGTATLERAILKHAVEESLNTATTSTSQELAHSEPVSGEATDMTFPEQRYGNLAIWLVLTGVALSGLLGMVAGARAGAIGIAVVLIACAIFRLVLDHPVGLVIRTKIIDMVLYVMTAVLIGILAMIAPNI